MAKARTLYDKIWDDHVAHQADDGTCLLYIDRHLVHEVTSPQAFEGLRMTGRKVRHPEKTLAVVDHNVPTTDRSKGIAETESRLQVAVIAGGQIAGGAPPGQQAQRHGGYNIQGVARGFFYVAARILRYDSPGYLCQHRFLRGAAGFMLFQKKVWFQIWAALL